MNKSDLADILILAAVVLIVVIVTGGFLIGQNLRNERAMLVTAGDYTTTIVTPPNYSCEGFYLEPNVYVVQCSPWKGR